MSETRDLHHTLRGLADDDGWGGETWDPRRGEHPPADELSAYGAGGLDGARRERLQEHLTTCAECTALVTDQALFPDLPADGDEPGDFAIAAAWRDFRGRLDAAAVAGSRRRAPGSRPAVPWAVAASLLVACLALGAWDLHLDRRLATLTAPQPNVVLGDLEAADERSGAQEAVEVEARGAYVLLIAYPSTPPGLEDADFVDYGWKILDAHGRQLLGGSGLEKQRDFFTLLLYRDSLPAGSYEMSLTGTTRDGRSAELGSLPFRIPGE